jgi:hypothetical protein
MSATGETNRKNGFPFEDLEVRPGGAITGWGNLPDDIQRRVFARFRTS